MFTFKKLALVGAAGLAAFSMSCSDDGGTDPGGSWAIPFNAVYNDGIFDLSGKITAVEGNTISSVTGTVNGTATLITGAGVQAGDFTDAFIGLPASLCADKGGQTITAKVEVKAVFVSGDPLTGSKDVSVTCSGASAANVPIRTLQVGGTSNALGSFVDLDGNVAYLSGQVAANASKIDIVYTVGFKDDDNDALGDNIFSAGFFKSMAATNANYSELTGSYIVPLETVATADVVEAAKTALTTGTSVPAAAIAPYATIIAGDSYTDKIDTEISVAIGNVFISKGNNGIYLVAIKAKNGTTDITIATLKVVDL